MSTRRSNVAEPAPPPAAFVPAPGSPGPDFLDAAPTGPLALRRSAFAPRAVRPVLPGRCVEKGCVFPAQSGAGGRCVHHQRQQQEPGLYSSQQPSSILVARGRFGPSSIEEIERGERGANREDRRRLTAEREKFLGE
jgi:hypothetical protein